MFCKAIPIKPKSQQADRKRLKRYQERIQSFLKTDSQLISVINESKKLSCSIYYFHRKKTDVDVDNICKPLIDATKGIIINDDHQVFVLLAARVHVLEDDYEITNTGMEPEEYENLLDLISKEDNVIYIEFKELMSTSLSVGGRMS